MNGEVKRDWVGRRVCGVSVRGWLRINLANGSKDWHTGQVHSLSVGELIKTLK